LNENGLRIGPPTLTTGGILMTAGALLAVIGLIAWFMSQRRAGK